MENKSQFQEENACVYKAHRLFCYFEIIFSLGKDNNITCKM